MLESKSRRSNIEWLRVIAMLMIIAYHAVIHGNTSEIALGLGDKIFLECASLWGKAGVNLFCLIMGYFGVSSTFRVKKVIQLEAQIIFYSFLGFCIALVFKCEMNLGAIAATIFPNVFNHYWFITAYLMVYILSPYINKTLLSLSNVQFRRLILIIVFFWCIIPFFSLQENNGLFWNQFIWFVVMYVIGAYIRTHKRAFSKRAYWITELICNVFLILSVIAINWGGTIFPALMQYTTYFRWSNSPLIICICISMVRLAECVAIKQNKVINFLAAGTLGIYLFHENVFIRELLWDRLFSFDDIGSYTIAIYFFMVLLSVFLIGSMIDAIRRLLFVKLDAIFSFISSSIDIRLKKNEKKIDQIFSNGC